MENRIRKWTAVLAISATIAGCGGHGNDSRNTAAGDVAYPSGSPTTPATSTMPADTMSQNTKHHSKLAGAAVGAAVGHLLGGHAVAGAAAGALIQHHRNKHP